MYLDSADDQPSLSDMISSPPTTFTMTNPAFVKFLEDALNSPLSNHSRAILNGEEPHTSRAARLDAYFNNAERLTEGPSKGGIRRVREIEENVYKIWQRDAEDLWAKNKALWNGKPSFAAAGKLLSRRYHAALKNAKAEDEDRLKRLARSPRQIRDHLHKPA